MTGKSQLLELSSISKRFGHNLVLNNIDFDLREGEVEAILGENGAGKSTLIKILSGAYQPDGGVMKLAGEAYCPSSPVDGLRQGLAVIYQELNLAPHLTVEENIMLGQEVSRFGLVNRKRNLEKIREVLNFLHHPEISPEVRVSQLSAGARQVVEIARALVRQSRILIMDEPTSSLSGEDTNYLFEIIKKLKSQGTAVVYVSHFLEEVRQVADRFVVLRDGQVAGRGKICDISIDQLIEMIIGQRLNELYPRIPHQPGQTIMECAGLKSRKMTQPVFLEVREGEILGVAGLVGAGRTEFLRALFGLDRVEGGLVVLKGQSFRPVHPEFSIKRGLGFLSEDRQSEGLALRMSVTDNLTLSYLRPYSSQGLISGRKQKQAASSWVEKLSIRTQSPEEKVWTLSGGNQQKVALARLLHQQASIFLMDEPTRGIDVKSKSQIYEIMGRLAAEKKTVIFVSSYLPELLGVSDRLAVFHRGQLIAVRPAADWTETSLMKAAVTGKTDEDNGKRCEDEA